MDRPDAPTTERALGGALEPVIGQVYFSPEAHASYAALGFQPSQHEADGVALPDGPAYFTSRGSVMGDVRGSVVASAFAVFKPAIVVPAVDHGWTLTDASTICAARDHGAIGQLERILGPDPDGLARVTTLMTKATRELHDGAGLAGRPLAAGIAELPPPDHPLGSVWRCGDLLREFRGDGHTMAWAGAGLSAVEIGLLTELYWGLPPRSYARTRGWSDEDFEVGSDRLRSSGLIDDTGFTDAGRGMREAIEHHTDDLMHPVMSALGTEAEELIATLAAWGSAIRAERGYLASGPHDLAARASGA